MLVANRLVTSNMQFGLRLFDRLLGKTLGQRLQRKQFTVPEHVTVFADAKFDTNYCFVLAVSGTYTMDPFLSR